MPTRSRDEPHALTKQKLSWEAIVDGLSDIMSKQLSQVRKDFDFVLIDCAPGISVLTEISIRPTDLVIIPTIAEFRYRCPHGNAYCELRVLDVHRA